VVNELPPEKRFKRENLILAGIYIGNSKPHQNIFFKIFITKSMKLIRDLQLMYLISLNL